MANAVNPNESQPNGPKNPDTQNRDDARKFGATTPPPAERSPEDNLQPTGAAGQTLPPQSQSGGVKVRLERDYWPKEQPKNEEKRDTTGRITSGPHREYRIPAGHEVSLPRDEAMDLIEAGHAKRVKDGK